RKSRRPIGRFMTWLLRVGKPTRSYGWAWGRSAEMVHPRHRDARDRVGAPGVLLRRQVLGRGEHVLPGDLLARVGGLPAEDRHERAVRGRLGVVDQLAAADAGEQLVVFHLVHVLVRGVPELPPAAPGQGD